MEEFYTVSQAAIALKVHPLTVRRYIREGKLKAFRIGGNIRIGVNDLRLFTQSFIPRQPSAPKETSIQQAKQFSFNDPILSLKGKGLNLSKLQQE